MNYLKIKISNGFLNTSVLVFLLFTGLQVYYYHFILVNYEYMKYDNDFNFLKFIIAHLFFGILMMTSSDTYHKSRFLYSIFILILIFFFLPVAVLFAYSNGSFSVFLSNAFFVGLFTLSPYIKINLPAFSFSEKNRQLLLFFISFSLFIPIVLQFGLTINLKTLLLEQIYETREQFSTRLTGYVNYLYHFSAKTLIPVSIVFFLYRKKYFLVSVFCLMLLYLFVISGNKIVYFTTAIVLFFYYLGKNVHSKITYFLLLCLAAFLIFPLIDNLFFSNHLLQGTFVNRFFFIPALLTNFYFDFFKEAPFYFAESHFFNSFVQSPYDMPVGFLITKVYWNEPEVYANNGLISDGFMNLGYWGVLIFSVIFLLLFSLFNSLHLPKGYFGIFFCYIYILLSAPLLTCFITGGILLFLVVSVIILKDKKT